MAKTTAAGKTLATIKKSRPGIHSKNNTSKLTSSKNYKKAYKGQGR
jgi:hypothetical protein